MNRSYQPKCLLALLLTTAAHRHAYSPRGGRCCSILARKSRRDAVRGQTVTLSRLWLLLLIPAWVSELSLFGLLALKAYASRSKHMSMEEDLTGGHYLQTKGATVIN